MEETNRTRSCQLRGSACTRPQAASETVERGGGEHSVCGGLHLFARSCGALRHVTISRRGGRDSRAHLGRDMDPLLERRLAVCPPPLAPLAALQESAALTHALVCTTTFWEMRMSHETRAKILAASCAAAAADAGIALMLKLAATLTELDHPQADDFLVAHGTRTRATSHSHKASPESTI